MNSPFVAAQAKDAARRILADEDFRNMPVADRIDYAFRLCIGRLPVADEKAVLLEVVGDDPDSEVVWSEVLHSLFASFSFRHFN